MNMKVDILAALKELFDRREELLTSLSEQEITIPRFDHSRSIQDVIAHLWAWQQITLGKEISGLL